MLIMNLRIDGNQHNFINMIYNKYILIVSIKTNKKNVIAYINVGKLISLRLKFEKEDSSLNATAA